MNDASSACKAEALGPIVEWSLLGVRQGVATFVDGQTHGRSCRTHAVQVGFFSSHYSTKLERNQGQLRDGMLGGKARERVTRKRALIRRLLHSAHPVFDFLCGRLRPVDGWSGVCISGPLRLVFSCSKRGVPKARSIARKGKYRWVRWTK